MKEVVHVRRVQEKDLETLVRLEEQVWRPRGITPLSAEEILAWYEEDSPFFLVAECGGTICGSYFGRQVSFTLETALSFLEPSRSSGKGYSLYPHEPNRRNLYGINILSTVPGAGQALYQEVFLLKEKLQIQYSIAFTRLTGFARYVERYACNEEDLDTLALWYAHESARLLRNPIWSHGKKKPKLERAPLRKPDAMLAFHIKGTKFGLLGVMPKYMPDSQSLDYGALILSEFPHQ